MRLLLAFFLVFVPALTETVDPGPDARRATLVRFFEKHHSKLGPQAEVFLAAADRNRLDWRLLPAISIAETGGGRTSRSTHNIFGWNDGRKSFRSVTEAIQFVASRLAQSSLYRGKSTEKKLLVYNRDPRYTRKILALMRQLPVVIPAEAGR